MHKLISCSRIQALTISKPSGLSSGFQSAADKAGLNWLENDRDRFIDQEFLPLINKC